MNIFSVFRLADGLFTGQRVSAADADSARSFLPRDMGLVAGIHDHLCRRVILSTGEVASWRPEAPADTDLATWCWHEASERWVAEPTLAALKAAAWCRVKELRDNARGAQIEAGGHWFDAGAPSRAALAQKALAAHVAWTAGSGAEWSVEWTTAANQPVTLGAREVINLALALDQRDQAQHTLSQSLRDAIAAATCRSELDAIAWPSSSR